MFQRLHEWDPATDRSLVMKIEAALVGEHEKARTILCDKLLVRRNDVLTVAEGALHNSACRIDPADQLEDDLDGWIVHDRIEVSRETVGWQSPRLGRVFDPNSNELDWPADLARDGLAVVDQHPVCAGSNSAEPKQSDTYRAGRRDR